MRLIRIPLLIEISLIILYYLISIFSIIIQPLNLILGYLIVFILPGYNFLSIIKPAYKFIEKIGYAVILSLAIENILMLFSYITLYNNVTYPETTIRGFKFNTILLISGIIIINLGLIIINEFINYKRKSLKFNKFKLKNLSFKKINSKLILKDSIILLIFISSLVLLCVSSYYSEVPNNDYETNR
ncbi:MAG: hypothetical protein V3V33_12825, partial [Candidatus Lokiarchaeia archaeon]